MTETEVFDESRPERSLPRSNEDVKLEKTRIMLESIKPGWSMAIERKQPGWCGGYLERVECTEDEPLDIEYIIEQWGGKLMRLRILDERGRYTGGCDLNLRAYPPKFRGVVISQEVIDHPGITKSGPAPVPVPELQQNPPAPQSKQPNLIELLGILQKTRSQDLATLKMLFTDVQQPQPVYQQQTGSLGGIDEVIHFAEKFKQLQVLFGSSAGGAAPEDETTSVLGSIAQIAQMLQRTPETPAKVKSPSRVVAPQQNPRQKVQPQVNPQQQEPSKPENGEQLADMLANMDEDRYRQIFLTSLQKMPQDKSGRIISDLMESGAPNNNDVEEWEEDEYDDEEPEGYEESEDEQEHSST